MELDECACGKAAETAEHFLFRYRKLFGHDVDAFKCRLLGVEALTEAEHSLWRRTWLVGKLNNLVVSIHRLDLSTNMLHSVQHEAFADSFDSKLNARKPLDTVLDNETR